MTTWQGAWYLAKEEFRRMRWKHLITVVFIGYLSIFLVPMFADGLAGDDVEMVFWALDFITLSLLPCLGLMSNQALGNYWKTDPYTKKLASWRTMPIRLNQIVLGRILTFLLNALPALTIFFILFFITVRSMTDEIELAAFIPFAVLWIGYSIAVGIIYLYVEFGFSGKIYFWFCMAVTFVFLGSMILSAVLWKRSFVIESYRLSADGEWWLALVGIFMAAAAIYFGRPLLEKKLRQRSYSS